MTTNKDFKRLVRARMRKTGEAYTAARRHLVTRQPSPAAPVAALHQPPATEYARIARMSDEALKAKTGCTWQRWVTALDSHQAYNWSHRAIAEFIREKYHVPSWWTQTVTVGYERIKGLREVGGRRDGSGFEATKSKTFEVPVSRLYRAFKEKGIRTRWLPGVTPAIRTAKQNKSIRMTWPDGTSVELYFAKKGVRKSQVQVQHRRLADKATATGVKQYWAGRLAALDELYRRKPKQTA
ncbi:MAG: hypothetical protein HY700_06920 [Gemmatimonadetes bacterium]|nr:hypothetical protein [Gemmatimonadota bacterium]